jgi:glycosyltransferase involved in cell wall biosynthesis
MPEPCAIVAYSTTRGGAGIATGRLVEALRRHAPALACTVVTARERAGFTPPPGHAVLTRDHRRLLYWPRFAWDAALRRLMGGEVFRSTGLAGFALADLVPGNGAVNLHWCNEGTVALASITAAARRVVMTLHDGWLTRGLDHYAGAAPLGFPWTWLEARVRRMQRRVLDDARIVFVCPSTWLARELAAVGVAAERIHVIPNPLDTDRFQPAPGRRQPGVTDLVVGFMGSDEATDRNKGFDLAKLALAEFRRRQPQRRIVLRLAGRYHPRLLPDLPCTVVAVDGDEARIAFHNACDVLLVPSRSENLSNVIAEALACGTPVAAFDIGGNGDLVAGMENGHLAPPFLVESLAEGLAACADPARHAAFAAAGRARVVERCGERAVAASYATVLAAVLAGG